MDESVAEQLLLALCRRSNGDVHLDLAELDSIDVSGLLTLLRGAAAMCAGYLVLHNAPASLRLMLEVIRDAVGDSGLRVV